MQGQRLAFDTNLNLSDDLPESLIREFFPPKILKALMILCLRVDIADNNDKADIVKELLNTIDGSEGFEELGVGTNRAAFLYRGLAIKIALDRRGL